MTASPGPSPLAQADPNSLDLIFGPDPTTLSQADYLRLVHELRRRRTEFKAQEALAANKVPKARSKAQPVDQATAAVMDKPTTEITLDDL